MHQIKPPLKSIISISYGDVQIIKDLLYWVECGGGGGGGGGVGDFQVI